MEPSAYVHATGLAILAGDGRWYGALLRGRPGAGKSHLAWQLFARAPRDHVRLVADDVVELVRRGPGVHLRRPRRTPVAPGLLYLRGRPPRRMPVHPDWGNAGAPLEVMAVLQDGAPRSHSARVLGVRHKVHVGAITPAAIRHRPTTTRRQSHSLSKRRSGFRETRGKRGRSLSFSTSAGRSGLAAFSAGPRWGLRTE